MVVNEIQSSGNKYAAFAVVNELPLNLCLCARGLIAVTRLILPAHFTVDDLDDHNLDNSFWSVGSFYDCAM